MVLFFIGKYLFTGWADGLVAVYFGLSSLLMYFLVIDENNPYRKNKIYYLIASCFFILLTLIKNEGFALLFILFTSTFLVNFYKKKLNKNLKNLIYLSSCFIPILLWKYFFSLLSIRLGVRSIPPPNQLFFVQINLVLKCIAGILGFFGCRTTEIPEDQK